MFAGLLEDVFGYETIPVRPTERFGSTGVGGLITGETFGREG